ncbi:MAG: EMC3/TMCO1 family protein [Candidatus Micrarchaeota archaeon]
MIFEGFAALVGFLAVLYAGVTKFVQSRLIDKKEMEQYKADSKRLSEEFEKAKKSNDKKRMEKAMDEQMKFLSRSQGMMMNQFRPMIYILAVFFAFSWVIGALDPTIKDDIALNMSDDGSGCDDIAGDRIFTACYGLQNETGGKWTASAKAYRGGSQMSVNETYFLVGPDPGEDTYHEMGSGEHMVVSTERTEYSLGETVKVTAEPANMTKGTEFIVMIFPPQPLEVDRVELTLSKGTYFRVDLPLAIPLLNIQTIYQPYWWFIFVSLIANLGIGFVMNQYEKIKKK